MYPPGREKDSRIGLGSEEKRIHHQRKEISLPEERPSLQKAGLLRREYNRVLERGEGLVLGGHERK